MPTNAFSSSHKSNCNRTAVFVVVVDVQGSIRCIHTSVELHYQVGPTTWLLNTVVCVGAGRIFKGNALCQP